MQSVKVISWSTHSGDSSAWHVCHSFSLVNCPVFEDDSFSHCVWKKKKTIELLVCCTCINNNSSNHSCDPSAVVQTNWIFRTDSVRLRSWVTDENNGIKHRAREWQSHTKKVRRYPHSASADNNVMFYSPHCTLTNTRRLVYAI